MVQLTSAVIGDINDVYPGIHTPLGVVAVHNTLHYQGDIVFFFHVGDGVPSHHGLMGRISTCGSRATRLGHIAFHHIPLASGIHLGVCSKTKARVACGQSTLNVIVHPSFIPHKVELINSGAGHALGDGFIVRRTG